MHLEYHDGDAGGDGDGDGGAFADEDDFGSMCLLDGVGEGDVGASGEPTEAACSLCHAVLQPGVTRCGECAARTAAGRVCLICLDMVEGVAEGHSMGCCVAMLHIECYNMLVAHEHLACPACRTPLQRLLAY